MQNEKSVEQIIGKRIQKIRQAKGYKIAELNRQTELHPPTFEKRTYTVSEIQDILGIGRNAAYAIVKKGYFSTVRIGGTIRISKRSFDAWLDEDSKPCQVCDDN